MTLIETFSSISPINKCICLKSKERNQDAFKLLKEIELFTKPIMSSRGWKVGVLAEFFPKNKTLLGLNINKGSKICIRLRTCNDENTFYPLDYLIEIMLHELVHNVLIMKSFMENLLNKLNSEFNQLLSSKYYEKDAYSKSSKLDKGLNIFTNCNGLRLGGNGNTENKSLRDLIRDATEKRIKNLKWCESNSCIVIKGKKTFSNFEGKELFLKSIEPNSSLHNSLKKQKKIFESESFQSNMVSENQWSCSLCTFKNNESYLQCEMCLLERSNVSEFLNEKWKCSACLCVNQKNQYSCEFCNTIRA
ncbi:uncharacterized protein T551_02829 [Pneumocystis jirovecii RU7]|uniref:WLM domain-containing protein n=1 Tax=Pneumocystis jirovecii (strain RU7) TaxID=1408657 RepID=A0A0W4ZHL5_PNEJ7|nr:uncharacterized protein T551_02829 [Pneumocystis jirovecii RU7]KTW27862.1 hypothetical protein T551_02829 [Pneumocystis jirovecii RU7]